MASTSPRLEVDDEDVDVTFVDNTDAAEQQ